MKIFNMNRKYMDAAGADGSDGGGGNSPAATPNANPPATPPATPPAAAVPPTQTPTPEAPKLNYSDPASKQVGTMLTDAGVDPIKARDAITANGGQCTPEIFAALQAKHGEGMASLLAGQMTKLHEAGVAKGNAQDQAVYTQVEAAFKGITEQSGKETWAELSGWAKENIDNDQRKALNAAIAQGGFVAQLAVQELVNAFQQSGDYGQEMIGLEGDNVPNAPKGGDLTRFEYTEELDKLLNAGHAYDSPQVKTLQARRTRSAQRGI